MDERLVNLLSSTAVENAHVTHSQLYNALKGAVRDHLPNELAVEDTVHQFLVKNDYIMPEETRRQVYRATYQYRHRPTLETPDAAKSRLGDAPIRAFGPQKGTYGHFIEQVADAIKSTAQPDNIANAQGGAWLAEFGVLAFDHDHILRGPLTAPYLFANGTMMGGRDGKFVHRHSNDGQAGSFVQSAATIPVKSGLDLTVTDADRNKLAVIVGFADELKEQTYPQIEGLLRESILQDTLSAYDYYLYDAEPAVPQIRPAAINAGVDTAASTGPLADLELLAVRADAFRMTHPVIVLNPVTFQHLSHRQTDEYLTAELNKIHDAQEFKGIPIILSEMFARDGALIFDVSLFQYRAEPIEWDISDKATIEAETLRRGTPIVEGPIDEPTSVIVPFEYVTFIQSLTQVYASAVRMVHQVSWVMTDNSGTFQVTGVSW